MPIERLEKALAKQSSGPYFNGATRPKRTRRGSSCLRSDILLPEISHQCIHSAEFEAAAEDQPYPFGFLLDGGNFAVVHLISKGEGTADPETLSFGGSNLVPDSFGGNLAFELGKTLSVRRPMEVELLC